MALSGTTNFFSQELHLIIIYFNNTFKKGFLHYKFYIVYLWIIYGVVSSVGRASRLHREGHRFESFTTHHKKTLYWGCSSVWLERLPVTQEAAGSSPVTPAIKLNNFLKLICKKLLRNFSLVASFKNIF